MRSCFPTHTNRRGPEVQNQTPDPLLHVSTLQKRSKWFCRALSSCDRRSSLAAVFRCLSPAMSVRLCRATVCPPMPACLLCPCSKCCLLPMGVGGRCALKIKGERRRGQLWVRLRGSTLFLPAATEICSAAPQDLQPDLAPSPLVSNLVLLLLLISLSGPQT